MLLLKEVIEIRNKNCVVVTFYRVLLLELWHVRVPQYSKVLLIAKECNKLLELPISLSPFQQKNIICGDVE